MAGKIIADTLEHSTAGSVTTDYVVEGVAKGWSYFQGTGTAAINDSFNHSSLSDDGTGRYTLNITNDMSGTQYSLSLVRNTYHVRPKAEDPAAGSYKMESDYVSGTGGQMTANDAAHVHTQIFGDLA